MILYDLVCSSDHRFEAWFKDGAACDTQMAAGEVSCPSCGNKLVRKAPMAPNLARSTRKESLQADPVELRKALLALRRHVEANADYVGPDFAEEARKMHYGEVEERAIYGEASSEEARDLEEEGIETALIPWLPNQDS